MGKAIGGVSEAAALSDSDPGRERIGTYLARQRKLRGITLDELESLTHIPRRSLERLESGVYDGQPDGFVRGFVRTVSEAIGLDPEDTVARMLAEPEVTRDRGPFSLQRAAAALLVVGVGVLMVALAPGVLRSRQQAALEAAPAAYGVRRDAVRALFQSVQAGAAGAAPADLAPPGASPAPLPSTHGGDPDPGPPAALH